MFRLFRKRDAGIDALLNDPVLIDHARRTAQLERTALALGLKLDEGIPAWILHASGHVSAKMILRAMQAVGKEPASLTSVERLAFNVALVTVSDVVSRYTRVTFEEVPILAMVPLWTATLTSQARARPGDGAEAFGEAFGRMAREAIDAFNAMQEDAARRRVLWEIGQKAHAFYQTHDAELLSDLGRQAAALVPLLDGAAR